MDVNSPSDPRLCSLYANAPVVAKTGAFVVDYGYAAVALQSTGRLAAVAGQCPFVWDRTQNAGSEVRGDSFA